MVSLINNFVCREDLEYYTVPQGKSSHCFYDCKIIVVVYAVPVTHREYSFVYPGSVHHGIASVQEQITQAYPGDMLLMSYI